MASNARKSVQSEGPHGNTSDDFPINGALKTLVMEVYPKSRKELRDPNGGLNEKWH